MIDDYLRDIEEISRALELSHASKGGTVAIVRSIDYLLNPSALGTINAWTPKHKITQTTMLDLAEGGDGGKTSVFIFRALVRELRKLPIKERIDMREVILKEAEEIYHDLRALSSPASDEDKLSLETVDQGLASALNEAVKLSNGGHISLERGESVDVRVEQTDSLITDMVSLDYDEDKSLKGPMIALFGEMIMDFDQILETMEMMGTFEGRPLLICAPMISKKVRSAVALNRNKGVLDCHLIEAPRVSWGKGWMEDVGAFTGATIYDKNLYGKFRVEHYGSALEITLKKDQMIIDPYDDHIDATSERAESLLREASASPHTHTKDLLQKRAYALLGSLVRVKIGGVTELEAKVRRSKAEKLLLSVSDMHKNGRVEGIVPALAMISKDTLLGKALREPWYVICKNLETYQGDPSVLERARHPFPTGRAVGLVEKAIANALTISMVEREIERKRR